MQSRIFAIPLQVYYFSKTSQFHPSLSYFLNIVGIAHEIGAMYYLLEAEMLFACDTTMYHSVVFHTSCDIGKLKCPVQSLGLAFALGLTTGSLT
jgi:hypothetical protein